VAAGLLARGGGPDDDLTGALRLAGAATALRATAALRASPAARERLDR
jgi:hypothetical protein